ncbi:MAG: methionyl-tRNA formyltransferase [Rubrobacter sp.]
MKHPGKGVVKRVAAVGCKHTTKDLILGLQRCGFRFDHCITIDPEMGKEQMVAGYMNLVPFLESQGIPYTVSSRYDLKSAADREALLSLELDALLVMGWQRLIPAWWLESLSIGAFGMHGSSRPLPHGRGRSPMNWSLVQGKDLFYTHLFQYKPGVDDGPIVGVQTFDINPHDDCLTLHFKNTVSMIRLCATHLPAILDGSARLTPQPEEAATYYPKRSEEDGLIYWEDSTNQICNLVRAVTEPFPGAFSFLDDADRKIRIWTAQPFDTRLQYPQARPGEIVEVFYNGMFVVRTGDATALVTRSEGYDFSTEDVGSFLGTRNTSRKKWESLPE